MKAHQTASNGSCSKSVTVLREQYLNMQISTAQRQRRTGIATSTRTTITTLLLSTPASRLVFASGGNAQDMSVPLSITECV